MVKRRVVTYLDEEVIEKLKERSKRLYGKKSVYRIAASLILKGLDDGEQGGGIQETDSRTGEADAEHGSGTGKEPDWKREYEEYKRKYEGR